MQERRQFPRFSVALKVAYFLPREPEKEVDVVSNDISLGGMGLKTFGPIEAGTELDLTIYKPFWDDPIEVKGRVVWSVCKKSGEGAVGIEFTKVPWTKITALINSLS